MKNIIMFERPFKSVVVVTKQGEVLVSEGKEIKIKTLNEETGETNEVEGEVLKITGKKMEIQTEEIPYPILVNFREVSEIETV